MRLTCISKIIALILCSAANWARNITVSDTKIEYEWGNIVSAMSLRRR
jgi:hypothetical protein